MNRTQTIQDDLTRETTVSELIDFLSLAPPEAVVSVKTHKGDYPYSGDWQTITLTWKL